jgi:hypothetical protein
MRKGRERDGDSCGRLGRVLFVYVTMNMAVQKRAGVRNEANGLGALITGTASRCKVTLATYTSARR